jgi:hypothetical protein
VIPFVRTLPAVLAAMFLGAHFFRAGRLVLVAACLVLAALLFVSSPGLRTFCRICLAVGVLVWLIAAWRIARVRIAAGEPYLRMLAILGAVAAFTAFAAWILPPGPPKETQHDA